MIGIGFPTPSMMSMLNQAAVEALCSATYLENYLDCMENLPDDLQRVVSQLRELDSLTNDILQDLTHHQEVYMREGDGAKKQRALLQIQRGLIRSQEVGDEKLQLVTLVVELIENRARQLEQDLENLDPCATEIKEEKPAKVEPQVSNSTKSYKSTSVPIQQTPAAPSTPALEEKTAELAISSNVNSAKSKRQRRQRTHAEVVTKEEEKKEEEEKPKKKKKRKVKKEKGVEKSNIDPPIDPDEPTYCLCEQVSYGEMIGCDYEKCEIEWFHFNCVSLTTKPKGKWFCPKCRGDKANVKRSDLK